MTAENDIHGDGGRARGDRRPMGLMLSSLRTVRDGARVLSAYELRDGTRIWIITEADRSVTTILPPEEY